MTGGVEGDSAERLESPPPSPAGDAAVPLLQLRGIEKHFGAVQALAGINIEVPASRVTALIGDNGAGKSVLIKCISGIYVPDGGQILWNGQPAHIRSPRDGVARPMKPFFRHIPIDEHLVHTKFSPLSSHNAYWTDSTTADLIAAQILSSF